MALAMWRTDDADLQSFADPRFFIAVPDELLQHAMPALAAFEEQAAQLLAEAADKEGKQVAAAAQRLAMVMRVCLVARIQDAIATAEQYPANPFNADMQQSPLFRWAYPSLHNRTSSRLLVHLLCRMCDVNCCCLAQL